MKQAVDASPRVRLLRETRAVDFIRKYPHKSKIRITKKGYWCDNVVHDGPLVLFYSRIPGSRLC